ncbi:AAA family ATPase [Larkinella punicea]|uniref:Chromosome partitioning protein ParA n=1 Tax=Larkinella punicea TaxID=2315727 RepID=A0A368JEM8_9BACT|nr:AAA family ATPase [Larkinella punicea]RCR65992.1 chromosome partitioning protein ParA [Larkinella punicea]
MIFTLGGIKGGSGKSTIATNLTVWLSKQGFDVLLVDADEQQTATKFTKWREVNTDGNSGYTATVLTGDAVRQQVAKFKPKFDHIVIDSGGRDTMSQRAALFVSDALLVPFNPRSFDLWTIADVETLVKEVRALKPTDLHAFALLNRADPKGTDNKDSAELLQESSVIEYVGPPIVSRKSFANASSNGLGVIENQPADQKAIHEITMVFKIIMEKLGAEINV